MARGYGRGFYPRPGRYGAMLVSLNKTLAANPATANGTQTHRIGAPAGDKNALFKCKLVAAAISVGTVGNDADGTILAYVIKRAADGDADTTLSASKSLESDGVTVSEQADFTLSGTEDQLTLAPGDVIEIDIVNNSVAIDTQPADVVVVLEFALLR